MPRERYGRIRAPDRRVVVTGPQVVELAANLPVSLPAREAPLEITALLGENAPCPAALSELREQLAAAATGPLSDDLLAERDRLSRLLIDTMERCAATRAQTPATVAEAIDRLCNAYLRRQLDRDLALVRRPLFRRMSQA